MLRDGAPVALATGYVLRVSETGEERLGMSVEDSLPAFTIFVASEGEMHSHFGLSRHKTSHDIENSRNGCKADL
jgi:hypothetical protein